jgi:hypothetical protein
MKQLRMALVVIAACAALGQATTASAAPAAPGESVVGQGKLPGAPELIVGQSGGNDVLAVAAGTSPAAFGGGPQNLTNACLPAGGFVDIGSGTFAASTRKHQYSFSFPTGTTVTQFSLRLSDWGDFLPNGAAPDGALAATLAGYDAAGDQVAASTFTFHSASSAVTHRPSLEFGDLFIAGDACSASDGQPGNARFEITGQGIARVEFSFANLPSTDPLVALSSVGYTLSDRLPSSKSDCLDGGWGSFHLGTARFKNQGDCVSWMATNGKNGPAA